jgi:hypothetical protein
MAKLGEPPIFGPGMFYVACLRCKTHVGIQNHGSSIRLSYDVRQWQQSNCCCLHADGPASCCQFDELRQAINGLPVRH